jgi:tudor domain-containing protein 3
MASAAAEAPGASASSAENRLLQSLAERGWRFRDPTDEAIQALLLASPTPSPEAVESELVSMDLRMFGGKCLPDRAAAGGTSKRLSYLHGPVVLQVLHKNSKITVPNALHRLIMCPKLKESALFV